MRDGQDRPTLAGMEAEGGPRVRYLVEWYVPSRDLESLRRDVQRLGEVGGPEVRHVGSFLISADETCLVFLEAPGAPGVAAACRRAGIEVDRITTVEVIG